LIIFYTPFIIFGLIVSLLSFNFDGLKFGLYILINIIVVSFISYSFGNPAEANSVANVLKEILRE
jgi:hypothetical protein